MGLVSTWMGDRLGIPSVVGFPFFFAFFFVDVREPYFFNGQSKCCPILLHHDTKFKRGLYWYSPSPKIKFLFCKAHLLFGIIRCFFNSFVNKRNLLKKRQRLHGNITMKDPKNLGKSGECHDHLQFTK